MDIVRPVIGIPNSQWKKRAVKFARSNPNIVKIEVRDLCYECHRHRELLKMFDDNKVDYKSSSYYQYSIKHSKKSKEVTLKKIGNFKVLYESMRQNVFKCPGDMMPIITEDGCRLDGSHKLTVLEHMGRKDADVNVLLYDKVFTKKEKNKIMQDNLSYRKEIYDL